MENHKRMVSSQETASHEEAASQQPVIILQRSPNVVNHFSIAAANSTNSQMSLSQQMEVGKQHMATIPGKRNRNLSTIEHLPSL